MICAQCINSYQKSKNGLEDSDVAGLQKYLINEG
jgi:hypothetical protein